MPENLSSFEIPSTEILPPNKEASKDAPKSTGLL